VYLCVVGIVKEIAIMRTLEEHPNTVRLYDIYDQADTFVLVMELCSGK
jgi:calcium-dependent protein kinase